MKKTLKTKWDLGLLYPGGHKDPAIEQDMVAIEAAYEGFAKKYRDDKDFTKTEDSLLAAMKDYENLIISLNAGKPMNYFGLAQALDSQDVYAEAQIAKLSDRLTKAGNKIIFFDLALGKIKPELQEVFLRSEKLKPYRYHFYRIFLTAKYNLTEPEEKIISLKGQPTSMWVSGVHKLVAKQMFPWKGKQIPLSEAMGLIADLPTGDRRKLTNMINVRMSEISDFAESELNAIVTDKKIDDELRGLKNPYDTRFLSDEVDEKMILTLIDVVRKNYHISHRFMKLKAKMLKLPYLEYADMGASVGKASAKIPFEGAVRIVGDAFQKMDPQFSDILSSFLTKGQIDAFPKKGKTSGAFCWPQQPLPTYVLLNHMPKMDSAMTLAHEMGHSIHTELSGEQSVFYKGYSTATAEVASNFFENVVFDNVFETLSPKDKIIAIHDRILDSVGSIFRQVACFLFELDMHNEVRSKGFLPKERFAELMRQRMSEHAGPAVKYPEVSGYIFVRWPHIRTFFYVYSYAYGDLVSKALYANYKKDPKFIGKIKQFLSAGSSKSPYDIFKDIGIDTSDPKFFEDGIKEIENNIILLEKLVNEKPAKKPKPSKKVAKKR